MQVILGIIVGLLSLMFLIVAHEFGHFLMARKNGVRVKEFGIGFPPRAVAWIKTSKKPKILSADKTSDIKKSKSSKSASSAPVKSWSLLKKSDWKNPQDSLIFSLNWLPIGGFCAMDGESDADTKPGTFGAASFWKKTKILFGGVLMNWLVAFIIFTILCWTGLPEILNHQFTVKSDEKVSVSAPLTVAEVLEGSPAAEAGFLPGDVLLDVSYKESAEVTETKTLLTADDVIDFNATHAGQTLTYTVVESDRSDATKDDVKTENNENETASKTPVNEFGEQTLPVKLNDADADYLLGITMDSGIKTMRYGWSAPVVGAGLTVQTTLETYHGLWLMLKNLITGAARQISPDAETRKEGRTQVSEATEGVSGIVGIIGGYFPGLVSSGATYVFLFMAVISVSLACMNVLPIPALDGGRWLMIAIARLRHKRLTKEREQTIVAKAFIFLLILMAIITVVDIIRLF